MSVPVLTRTKRDADYRVSCTLSSPDTLPYYWGTGPVFIEIPVSGPLRLFEAITPNSSKDHKTWKAFQHYKCTNHSKSHGTAAIRISQGQPAYGNRNLPVGWLTDSYAFHRWQSGPNGQFNNGLTPWYVPQASGDFIPLESGLENLKQRGLKAMLPKIKADLSSLVSLYEAKDLISIKHSIKNIGRTARFLTHKLKGWTSKPIGKVLVRQTADSYLQWMFNLKPLVSDICGIYHAVTTYQRRINDLVNRSGTLQTAHFKCDLHELLNPVITEYAWDSAFQLWCNGTLYWSPVQSKMTRVAAVESATFSCSMQYNYHYAAFQRENRKILGLLDALGANFNPSYIWQVIPWSFVVDWVFDVGQWLDQFEVKNMEPRVNILQYCWSVKKVRHIYMSGLVKTPREYYQPGFFGLQSVYLPAVTETSYRRGIDLPTGNSFTTSGLSSTEMSLGAALITTRRRRNTKK